MSDISREKGVYILSYNSFNIASESLSCLPNSFHIQVFVVTLGFSDHRVRTSHCLRQEGVTNQPSLQRVKCAISSLDTGVPASPEAVCTCILHFIALTDRLCFNTNASFQLDPSHMLNVRLLPSNSLSQGSRT